jgi:hypothetical protein
MDIRTENGIVLVIAVMAMSLLTALGAALILTTTAETIIAGNFRHGREALYAADAAIERAVSDLSAVEDWNRLLDPSQPLVQSAFIDGPPSGIRNLPDGSTLDLGQALNMANCEKVTACAQSDLTAITLRRPWGANNPVWQLYAYGPLSSMLPSSGVTAPVYVTVMVADDPSENDGDPTHDGTDPGNPGSGVIVLRADAFGVRGAHAAVEATIERRGAAWLRSGAAGHEAPEAHPGAETGGARVISWRKAR